jgi:hypothetical protein
MLFYVFLLTNPTHKNRFFKHQHPDTCHDKNHPLLLLQKATNPISLKKSNPTLKKKISSNPMKIEMIQTMKTQKTNPIPMKKTRLPIPMSTF